MEGTIHRKVLNIPPDVKTYVDNRETRPYDVVTHQLKKGDAEHMFDVFDQPFD